jgi:Heterokaryon incompatibility protein (HET)
MPDSLKRKRSRSGSSPSLLPSDKRAIEEKTKLDRISTTSTSTDISKIYTPLHNVRLLTLLPGHFDDPIFCELANGVLEASPDYEALSYVWGNPRVTRIIQLQGHDFSVTENLESALRHLRLKEKSRILWVDALCINQKDLHEKQSQIQLMARIYGCASRVVVWLGQLDETAVGIAFGAVERMHQKFKEYERAYASSSYHSADRSTDEDITTTLIEPHVPQGEDLISFFGLSSSEVQSLRDVFYDSPWWTRIWCVQELVHAQEAVLIAGDQTVAWEKLLSSPRVHRSTKISALGNLGAIFRRVEALSIARSSLEHGIDDNLRSFSGLSGLLVFFAERRCSEPRDKIYALLNLSEAAQSAIKPDYSKSLSALCVEVTRFLILESRNLEVLCTYEYQSIVDRRFFTTSEAYCKVDKFFRNNGAILESLKDDHRILQVEHFPEWQGEISYEEASNFFDEIYYDEDNGRHCREKGSFLSPDDEMIPSWVPNFSLQPFTHQMTYLGLASCSYRASGPDAEIDMDIFDIKFPWLLKLNAILFDTITDTSPRIDLEKKEWKSVVHDWKEEFCLRTEYATNENSIDVFWRTITGDRSLGSQRRLTAAELDHLPAIMSSWFHTSIDANSRFEAHPPTIGRIFKRLSNTLTGRCLCLTAKGYLGVVGGSSLPGDVVCIVRGAPVPMVLRPHDFCQEARKKGIELGEKYAGAKFFTQAGVGYFHGIMDGEAMRTAKGRDVGMERIFLV